MKYEIFREGNTKIKEREDTLNSCCRCLSQWWQRVPLPITSSGGTFMSKYDDEAVELIDDTNACCL